MPGRKGMVIRAIGTHHFGSCLQRIDCRSHENHRKSVRGKHSSPRATPFYTSRFHSEHNGSWKVLQIIIVPLSEYRQVFIPQATKMLIFILNQQPSGNKRHTDISHLVNS